MVRPGYVLYGGNPTPGWANEMKPVVTLQTPVLQTRQVPAGTAVGYNATYVTNAPRRLATLAIGYAEGYQRSLSNRGRVLIAGQEARIVGRVSMDLTIVDVTAIAEQNCRIGSLATLIGSDLSIDRVGATADTIGYEILARLGNRIERRYLGGSI